LKSKDNPGITAGTTCETFNEKRPKHQVEQNLFRMVDGMTISDVSAYQKRGDETGPISSYFVEV